MATRIYLNDGASSQSPTFDTLWDVTAQALRVEAGVTKTNDPLTDRFVSETASTAVEDVLARQAITTDQVQTAHTISGTIAAVFRGYETNGSANGFLQLVAKVVSADGTTVRGILYAGNTQTTASATVGVANEEFPIGSPAAATRILPTVAVTPVAAQVGDRIVLEVGWRSANTGTSTRNVGLFIGDPTATADHTLTSGTTTNLVPWVELSDDVFAAPGGVSITVDGARSASRIGTPTLAHNTDLTVDGTRAATRTATPTLTHHSTITIDGTRTASRTGTPVLEQTTSLTVNGARAETRTGVVALDPPPTVTLTVRGARSATRTSSPTVAQTSSLTVAGTRTETRTGTVDLTAATTLTVDGTRAETRTETPLLAQATALTINGARAPTRIGRVTMPGTVTPLPPEERLHHIGPDNRIHTIEAEHRTYTIPPDHRIHTV